MRLKVLLFSFSTINNDSYPSVQVSASGKQGTLASRFSFFCQRDILLLLFELYIRRLIIESRTPLHREPISFKDISRFSEMDIGLYLKKNILFLKYSLILFETMRKLYSLNFSPSTYCIQFHLFQKPSMFEIQYVFSSEN